MDRIRNAVSNRRAIKQKKIDHNRIKIRQIRREASDGITTSMARHLPYDELAQIFSERANKLFDNF